MRVKSAVFSFQRRERNKYSEFWGRVSYITLFLGANIVFFPMHFLGLSGCPRRIPDVPNAYESLINISSIGTFILVFFLIYFLLSHVNWNHKEKKSIKNILVTPNLKKWGENLTNKWFFDWTNPNRTSDIGVLLEERLPNSHIYIPWHKKKWY